MPVVALTCNWWNHPELIDDFSEAVAGEAWTELLVMDNASEPDTARMLDERIPELGGRVIHRATNSQIEACAEAAEATRSEVLVFLNNDVRRSRAGWLERLVAEVREGTLRAHQLRSEIGVEYLDGWCLAVHRADWQKLGGYDPGYEEPPYWADVDLSWRARRLGMQLAAVDAGLVHETSTSIAAFRRAPWFEALVERNRARFEAKLAGAERTP